MCVRVRGINIAQKMRMRDLKMTKTARKSDLCREITCCLESHASKHKAIAMVE